MGGTNDTHEGREPETLTAVRAHARAVDAAQARLADAVRAARADGRSWADIGAAVGITRQSAHERWANALPAGPGRRRTAPAKDLTADRPEARADSAAVVAPEPPAAGETTPVPPAPAPAPVATGPEEQPAPREALPWTSDADPIRRPRWYTDAELGAAQVLKTGDGGYWVIVAGELLGTVRPHRSARGTRSGWQARHRGGGQAPHLGAGTHPATRDAAVIDLIAAVRQAWETARRRRQAEARQRRLQRQDREVAEK